MSITFAVTGGCGFLGKHLVKLILRQCTDIKEIRILDLAIDPKMKHWNEKVKLYNGSVQDYNLITKFLDGVDIVFHLASIVDVWYKYTNNYIFQVNVDGTQNILKASVNSKSVKVIVYTSSMEVVGPNEDGDDFILGNETTEYKTSHRLAYPISKQIAEEIVLKYSGKQTAGGHILQTCSLRPSGIYGEDCQLLKSFYTQAKKNGNVLIGCTPSHTSHSRVYVGNVAWMHLLAALEMYNGNENIGGEIFYCYDDSPLMGYDQFTGLLLSGVGITLKMISIKVISCLASMNDSIRKAYQKFNKRYSPVLNKHTFNMACTSFSIKTDKAFKHFKYTPIYTWDESFKNITNWLNFL